VAESVGDLGGDGRRVRLPGTRVGVALPWVGLQHAGRQVGRHRALVAHRLQALSQDAMDRLASAERRAGRFDDPLALDLGQTVALGAALVEAQRRGGVELR